MFGTLDHAGGASAIAGPAIEYNRGIAPELQFPVVVPLAWNVPAHGGTAASLCDVEPGIKYRFVNADDGTWQAGIFPVTWVSQRRTGVDCGPGSGNRPQPESSRPQFSNRSV